MPGYLIIVFKIIAAALHPDCYREQWSGKLPEDLFVGCNCLPAKTMGCPSSELNFQYLLFKLH
jgi:hypothetical protein